ncbi:YhfC family intramembrane metalloprotease [Coprothermobacter platensis]|uniref:YhfC family intramembrane metalloprotease n=1 Tax=Coprothermobacter platensis TaxID=108819 RepID=UPI00036189BF|nr:YhfC family intramembrane metalloprotease [Coprothermobacter platensis]
MWSSVWNEFLSFYTNINIGGTVGALLIVTFWILVFRAPIWRKPHLLYVFIGSFLLFGPSIAFIQIPLQNLLNLLFFNIWRFSASRTILLIFGIPYVLIAGFVQEGFKLLPVLFLNKRAEYVSVDDKVNAGIISGAGYGVFEAIWVLSQVFDYGFASILPFWERFMTVPFHMAATGMAAYGLGKKRWWQFFVFASILHALVDYSAVLVNVSLLSAVGAEVYLSVVTICTIVVTFWMSHKA